MIKISIIIPCRNEEKYIARCLDSLVKQTYQRETMEILVVDGLSNDKTQLIIKQFQKKYPFITLLLNPKKIIPCAMNIGIKKAKGELIMKMDAHTIYESNYIAQCVYYSKKYNADNVGGILKMTPRENTLTSNAIALALSHRFGSGNSYVKTGLKKPRFTDTVAFGCYKKDVFNRIGLYNEQLIRSSDMELNIRLKNAGGKILLAPAIKGYYYTDVTLKEFWKHNFKDGVWAIYPFKFTSAMLKLRHTVPLLFIVSILILALLSLFSQSILSLFLLLAILYIFLTLASSCQIAFRQKNIRYIFLMPVVFAIRHFIYGIGSLYGLLKLTAGR